jgi:hypothetical protein
MSQESTVALVITTTGRPKIVGQYTDSKKRIVWRMWNCTASYDAITGKWNTLAYRASRSVVTNQAEQRAYSESWVFCCHFPCPDQDLTPPFFGKI